MTMPVFADGVMVNAAMLNLLSSGINSLNLLLTGANTPRLYVPTVSAEITVNKSISNNTDTLVTFDTASPNNDAMWSAGVNHLTVKTAGVYWVWAQAHFTAAGGGPRAIHILLNGTSVASNSVAAGARNAVNYGDGNTFICMAPPMSMAVNATLYFAVYQNSGGALNLDATVSGAYMAAIRIGS